MRPGGWNGEDHQLHGGEACGRATIRGIRREILIQVTGTEDVPVRPARAGRVRMGTIREALIYSSVRGELVEP